MSIKGNKHVNTTKISTSPQRRIYFAYFDNGQWPLSKRQTLKKHSVTSPIDLNRNIAHRNYPKKTQVGRTHFPNGTVHTAALQTYHMITLTSTDWELASRQLLRHDMVWWGLQTWARVFRTAFRRSWFEGDCYKRRVWRMSLIKLVHWRQTAMLRVVDDRYDKRNQWINNVEVVNGRRKLPETKCGRVNDVAL